MSDRKLACLARCEWIEVSRGDGLCFVLHGLLLFYESLLLFFFLLLSYLEHLSLLLLAAWFLLEALLLCGCPLLLLR